MNDDIPEFSTQSEPVLWIGFGGDIGHVRDIFPHKNPHIAATLADLTPEYLQKIGPRWVICPLFPAQFPAPFPTGLAHHADAFSVLERLDELEFVGLVYVLAPPLPRPSIIQQELAQLSRKMTVRLIAGVLPRLDAP